jgi:hypothetical protein
MRTSKITRAVAVAAPVTGTYKLYLPVAIRQNDACNGHQIGVQYVLHLDTAGQVIGTPAEPSNAWN